MRINRCCAHGAFLLSVCICVRAGVSTENTIFIRTVATAESQPSQPYRPGCTLLKKRNTLRGIDSLHTYNTYLVCMLVSAINARPGAGSFVQNLYSMGLSTEHVLYTRVCIVGIHTQTHSPGRNGSNGMSERAREHEFQTSACARVEKQSTRAKRE